MAKIKYFARENKHAGTHSFYAVPMLNGTLTFEELCNEACQYITMEPTMMQAAVTEYIKAVERNVLKGFRVQVGRQFLTVYPNFTLSVKDEKDADGRVLRPATARMLNALKGRGKVEATVHRRFSSAFDENVNWQRVDAVTGMAVGDENPANDETDGTESGMTE